MSNTKNKSKLLLLCVVIAHITDCAGAAAGAGRTIEGVSTNSAFAIGSPNTDSTRQIVLVKEDGEEIATVSVNPDHCTIHTLQEDLWTLQGDDRKAHQLFIHETALTTNEQLKGLLNGGWLNISVKQVEILDSWRAWLDELNTWYRNLTNEILGMGGADTQRSLFGILLTAKALEGSERTKTAGKITIKWPLENNEFFEVSIVTDASGVTEWEIRFYVLGSNANLLFTLNPDSITRETHRYDSQAKSYRYLSAECPPIPVFPIEFFKSEFIFP
jgi:hypothetical protein